jgi:hypothetical protein
MAPAYCATTLVTFDFAATPLAFPLTAFQNSWAVRDAAEIGAESGGGNLPRWRMACENPSLDRKRPTYYRLREES